MERIKSAFRAESKFKMLLLSILITGLGYGLYKGMLDNFLAEVVQMGEMDRGITEFFRELPGIMLVFILAAFYMLSAESIYKVGSVLYHLLELIDVYKKLTFCSVVYLLFFVYNITKKSMDFSFRNVGQRTLYFVSKVFRNVQQVTLYYDTITFHNVGQKTL